jgi:glycosyltransferase involved in cell wall biosynthesis
MRLLHITYSHSSLTKGGTEVYVDALCSELKKLGVDNQVLVVGAPPELSETRNNNIFYFDSFCTIPNALESFLNNLLLSEKPDLLFIHTHDGCEPQIAQLAIKHDISYVFFVHTQGALGCVDLHCPGYQKPMCPNPLRPYYCMLCNCKRWSGNNFKTYVLELLKRHVEEILRFFHLRKETRYTQISKRCQNGSLLIRNAKFVVAFSTAQTHFLEKCGISNERILLLPQGLSKENCQRCLENSKVPRYGIIKFGFTGRMNAVKGADILVEAAKRLPEEVPFELHLYGFRANESYSQIIKTLAGNDKRIVLHDVVPYYELILAYRNLDVVCIPSVCFETGPYTLLEGVFSGCYTACSENIGQMEFARKFGKILSPNTSETWSNFFQECIVNVSRIREQARQNAVIAHSNKHDMATTARFFLERFLAF